jgi:menaquinol-cytochrome c reductase iron-sulfur subunit
MTEHSHPTHPDGQTRRSFHEVLIHGLMAVLTATIAIPAVAYLFVAPKSKRRSNWVQAADITQLPPRQPEEVVFHRSRVDGWKVIDEKTTAWVVKLDDQNVVAYTPACTHLGCAYHWDEQQKYFLCPCHTSAFGLDGKVLMGPAPRPLDRYAVRVDNGKLFIGSQIQRA